MSRYFGVSNSQLDSFFMQNQNLDLDELERRNNQQLEDDINIANESTQEMDVQPGEEDPHSYQDQEMRLPYQDDDSDPFTLD